MKSINYEKYGPSSALKLSDLKKPESKDNEVFIVDSCHSCKYAGLAIAEKATIYNMVYVWSDKTKISDSKNGSNMSNLE
ncbi:MAG: hypothetical protein WCJ54_04335 [Actinomycetota bacterium]